MHQVVTPERQTLSYAGNCLTGIQLSKEQLAILADIGERVNSGPGAFTVITNALFQSDGIDLYDSNCDEVPTAQANFMANLSSCNLEVLSEQCICLRNHKFFYDDTHKQALGYQNPFHLKKAQRIKPTLYDGSVIAKEHVVISMIDDEETLILEEESRSKMLDKQNDPISIEKKIKMSPIDYSKLNKVKEDFGKCFATKKELSAEQAV
ncbi:hypothetical protein Tco_1312306 [Tanacetum coccineum]